MSYRPHDPYDTDPTDPFRNTADGSDGSFQGTGSFNGLGSYEVPNDSFADTQSENVNPLLPNRNFTSSGFTQSNSSYDPDFSSRSDTSSDYGTLNSDWNSSWSGNTSAPDTSDTVGSPSIFSSDNSIHTPQHNDYFSSVNAGSPPEDPPSPSFNYTRIQPDSTRFDDAHGNAHILTTEDFTPSDQQITRKRKKKVGDLIGSIISAVFVGAFIYVARSNFVFQGQSKTMMDIITWGFGIIIGLFVIGNTISLIRFNAHPTDKRYYLREAHQAVWRSRHAERVRGNEARNVVSAALGAADSYGTSRRAGNTKMYKSVAKMSALIGLVMLIIGGSLIVWTVNKQRENDEFMKHSIEISAEVVSVRTQRSTSRKHKRITYSYYAIVDYEYEGTIYRRGEFKVDSSTKEGSNITVYIDPNNPGDCRLPENLNFLNYLGYLPLIVMGGAILVFSVSSLIKQKRRSAQLA